MGITRRGLGAVLALGLLVGGAAACSDDDEGGEGGGDTPTTVAGGEAQDTTTADGGDGDTPTSEGDAVAAANDPVIQEYCDATAAYNQALQASLDDPDSEEARDAVAAAGERSGEAATAVSAIVESLTPEQSAQFEECSDEAYGVEE